MAEPAGHHPTQVGSLAALVGLLRQRRQLLHERLQRLWANQQPAVLEGAGDGGVHPLRELK
jgi:hypothetical protein